MFHVKQSKAITKEKVLKCSSLSGIIGRNLKE